MAKSRKSCMVIPALALLIGGIFGYLTAVGEQGGVNANHLVVVNGTDKDLAAGSILIRTMDGGTSFSQEFSLWPRDQLQVFYHPRDFEVGTIEISSSHDVPQSARIRPVRRQGATCVVVLRKSDSPLVTWNVLPDDP